MTGLKSALHTWRAPPQFTLTLQPDLTLGAAQEVERRLSGIASLPPSPMDLEQIWQLARRSMDEGRDLRDIPVRRLNLLPWVMFDRLHDRPPLADERRFLHAFVDRLDASGRAKAIIASTLAFLQQYPQESPTFAEWCEMLDHLLRRCNRSGCRHLAACAADIGFFDEYGPEALWRILERGTRPVDEQLAQRCLVGPRARAGFAAAAFLVGTRRVRITLESGTHPCPDLDRLLEFAVVSDHDQHRLRFDQPRHIRALADALLLPFDHGNPHPDTRPAIQEFLMRHLGDPRLDLRRWGHVSSEAREVILRWLVQESLEDFFRLLEFTARGDEVAERHWRYRKAFWTAYLEAGVIRDAWVVLSPQLDRQAVRRMGLRREHYGRLKPGPGILRNHAVLMLRIGELLITDWSHNGKYRIWHEARASGRLVPQPYRTQYTRGELVQDPDEEGTHHGSDRGRWQKHLASYIEHHTGIRMFLRDCMPHA